jgi:Sulfotransferase family
MYFCFRVAEHADYFGELCEDANLERALHEALHPPVAIFADCGFDERLLLERAKNSSRSYAGLLDTIMSDFAARAGKSRWSEKSPGQSVDAAHALFPHAQFIHIVRDPRDVVASSLDAPWTDTDAATIAWQWLGFTLRNIRAGLELGPSQFLQIRYEDLTRNPAAVLRVVCAFLGERYDPMMLNASRRKDTVAKVVAPWQGRALSGIEPALEGGWKSRLSRIDRLRVNAIVGSTLAPLGYEPPSTRARLVSSPFRLAGRLRSAPLRLRRGSRPLTPEQRYELMRQFLESRADLVTDAQEPRRAPVR